MDTFRHFSSFLLVAGKRWPVLFDPCDIDRVSPDFYLVFMALVFLLIGVGDQRAPIKSFRNPGRHFAKKKSTNCDRGFHPVFCCCCCIAVSFLVRRCSDSRIDCRGPCDRLSLFFLRCCCRRCRRHRTRSYRSGARSQEIKKTPVKLGKPSLSLVSVQ